MIYNVEDRPKTIKELFLYALQILMSCFVATVLIAQIQNTPVSACLVGACIGTLVYQIITKFKSPMFISSCGATCSAVIGALAIGDAPNYKAVAIGGCIVFTVYLIVSLIVKKMGVEAFLKVFPPTIIGAVTIVIGCNLSSFIPTYVLINGSYSSIGVLIAIFTMIVVAITSHYCKGFLSTIPLLIGIVAGYILSIILTITGVAQIIDFSLFDNLKLFAIPDFTFKYWNDGNPINIALILQVAILFIPVALCSLLEHYSDHKVLSNIIGKDLTVEPGLDKTLLGNGTGSLVGTLLSSTPLTSYGESIATISMSRVASVIVSTFAAVMLGALAFIQPVQAFIASVPSCVFGGCSMILYGYIAHSGTRTLINNKVDLDNTKNLIIVSVILTVGVSGLWLFHNSFAGVSLTMVLGVILNLILKDNTNNINN